MKGILKQDIETFVADFPFEGVLDGKSVLVTGATGLIGSIIVRGLLGLKSIRGVNVRIMVQARNPQKVRSLFGDEDISLILGDITDSSMWEGHRADYIFHCASVTASGMMREHPVETLVSTFCGMRNVLEFARRSQSLGVIYLSSIESYGSFKEETVIKESSAGYVNALEARSCYPIGKKAAETLCHAFFKEYGTPVKIGRLTQTFGAGVNENDNRVFAQFARSVLKGEDIVLHTSGESSKPYCYTTDAVSALFFILFKGENGEAYNIATPGTYISVREMAEMVAREFGHNSKVVVELDDNRGYAPPTKSNLDSSRLMNLGWKPRYSLHEMYHRLLCYLSEK